MDEQAQRIAIAGSVGWKLRWLVGGDEPKDGSDALAWFHPNGVWLSSDFELPDYLSDLDAMHEAIMSQGWGDSEEAGFCLELDRICDPHGQDQFASVNATAKQRAEAYLRCIGKWQETAKAVA